MCLEEKLCCSRRRLSPAHCSKVLAFEGSCFTTPKVCWILTASENQKRPRSSGPEKVNRGYQFPQMHSLLDVDAGSGIGGSKAPAVIPIESFQTQDACTRVRVSRADVRRLDFHAARRIHIEPRSERAAHRVADLKSVHNEIGRAHV